MIPERLIKGDTIGLIAPSSPVLKEDLETINNSIMLMESAGFTMERALDSLKIQGEEREAIIQLLQK